jgi:hypothetical protein
LRVRIDIPPGWRTDLSPGGWTSTAGTGETLVESRLEPLPALGLRAWAGQRIRKDVPPGCDLVVEGSREGESTHGWPVMAFTCRVRAADGHIVQHRAVALYRFVSWAGAVELRADRPLTGADAPLVQLLLDATPDFSGEIACLADIVPGVRLS